MMKMDENQINLEVEGQEVMEVSLKVNSILLF